jgi:hypothetical protein
LDEIIAPTKAHQLPLSFLLSWQAGMQEGRICLKKGSKKPLPERFSKPPKLVR